MHLSRLQRPYEARNSIRAPAPVNASASRPLIKQIFQSCSTCSTAYCRSVPQGRKLRSLQLRCASDGIQPPSQLPDHSAKLAIFVSGGGTNFEAIHAAIVAGEINADVAVTSTVCFTFTVSCSGASAALSKRGNDVGGNAQVVVTNNPGCGGAEYAQANDIPVYQYSPTNTPNPQIDSDLLNALQRQYQVDYIILAGFYKVTSSLSLAHALHLATKLRENSGLIPSKVTYVRDKLSGRLHKGCYPIQQPEQLRLPLSDYSGLLVQLCPPQVVEAYRRRILNIHPALLPAFGGKGLYGPRVHQAVIASGARFSGATVHFVDEEYDSGPILAQAVVSVSPTDSAEFLAERILMEEHRIYPESVAALAAGRITWRDDGVPVVWLPV